MPNLEWLMGLATISGLYLERLVLRRFLLGMAAIVVLSVILSVLIAAALVAGLYLAYRLLLEHGVTADAALLIIGGVGVIFAFALCIAILYRFRRLRLSLRPGPDVANYISEIGEAFVDGFVTSKN